MTETKTYSETVVKYEAAPGVWVPAKVTVTNGELPYEEIEAYLAHGRETHAGKIIDEMTIGIDGEFVDLEYHFSEMPFQRIRRITGYLVGTLDRFNNAKRAEVNDRVKHCI